MGGGWRNKILIQKGASNPIVPVISTVAEVPKIPNVPSVSEVKPETESER